MDIQSLSDRIRRSAIRELEIDITKAFSGVRDMVRGFVFNEFPKVDGKYTFNRVLEAIEQECKLRLGPGREQAAIDAFLKDVEQFREQLNHLGEEE